MQKHSLASASHPAGDVPQKVAGGQSPLPPSADAAPAVRCTIFLEDKGQDFMRALIEPFGDHWRIVEANLQDRFWRGKLVHCESVAVGQHPDLWCMKEDRALGPLNYAITHIVPGDTLAGWDAIRDSEVPQ